MKRFTQALGAFTLAIAKFDSDDFFKEGERCWLEMDLAHGVMIHCDKRAGGQIFTHRFGITFGNLSQHVLNAQQVFQGSIENLFREMRTEANDAG